MTDLTDVINAFTTLSENENATMFSQGILLASAIDAGLKAVDVKRECGIATGKSARTLENRLKVARVFGEDWYQDCDWSIHMIAATAPGVEIAKPETHAIARGLMDTAIKGYQDDNGSLRPHSARTLRKLIAGDRVGAKPQTLVKQMDAIVFSANELTDKLVLGIPHLKLEDWGALQWCNAFGATVTVTITRTPQPVTVAVVETEEAA